MEGAPARLTRSLDEIDRARALVAHWHAHRSERDPNHQYEAPLTIISKELQDSLGRLRREYERLSGLDRDSIYAGCRRLDSVYYFVQRLWDWYRAKFDQRDSTMRPVLLAADEVVHSCYATAFPDKASRPSTEPLVFVEPVGAPTARKWHVLPEGFEPPTETNAVQKVFGRRIEILSVPTISMPAIALTEPWLLVLLAHEVGHHVHQGLGDQIWNGFGADLVGRAGDRVTGREPLWRSWAREIFADVFGVLLCGYAVIWAVSELEWSEAGEMATAPDGYPCPAVRWSLMCRVLEEAGLPDQPDLVRAARDRAEKVFADDSLNLIADHNALPSIAKAAIITDEAFPCIPPFRMLANFSLSDHQANNGIAIWRERLASASKPIRSSNRADARLCAAAAAYEWSARATDSSRSQREEFAGRVLDQLTLCHEDGSRKGGSRKVVATTSMADDLLTLPTEEFEARQ